MLLRIYTTPDGALHRMGLDAARLIDREEELWRARQDDRATKIDKRAIAHGLSGGHFPVARKVEQRGWQRLAGKAEALEMPIKMLDGLVGLTLTRAEIVAPIISEVDLLEEADRDEQAQND